MVPIERKEFEEGKKKEEVETDTDEANLKRLMKIQKEVEYEIKKKEREERDNRRKEPRIAGTREVSFEQLTEGMLKKLVEAYRPWIGRIVTASYRPAYEKMRQGILIEMKEKYGTPDGTYIDTTGLQVSSYSGRMNVTLIDLKSTIHILQDRDKTYVEVMDDAGAVVAAAAAIGIMVRRIDIFYECVLMVLTHLTAFTVGEVDLAGYDEYVEKGSKIVRYVDDRIANRHILLYGPPGCGKTQIAKRIVKENPDLMCLNITVNTNLTLLVPVLERMLRRINKRMIIVIDEIDELGVSREVNAPMTFALLRMLDGVAEMKNIKFIATTNRLNVLDSALLRPGRLGPPIRIPPPNDSQKIAIVEHYNRKFGVKVNATEVIQQMKSEVSGAEIRAAFENCLIFGEEVNAANVVKFLKEMKYKEGPKGMYQ